jgi:hypothetical protein
MCFLPNVRHSYSPMHCRMNIKNGAIESHGCELSNNTDSNICWQYIAKIWCPEDEVLSRLSCFFLDFLIMCVITRVWCVQFLLRVGTLHSCQQVVNSKSLVPLTLYYIFPLLFLTKTLSLGHCIFVLCCQQVFKLVLFESPRLWLSITLFSTSIWQCVGKHEHPTSSKKHICVNLQFCG